MEEYFIKIDPYSETIDQITHSDSYAYLARQLGSRHIGIYAKQPFLDAAMMNVEALETDLLPAAWRYVPTGEVYFGPAIWLNISETGELRAPLRRVDQLLDEIEFLGFMEASTDFLPLGENLLDDSEGGDDHSPDIEF